MKTAETVPSLAAEAYSVIRHRIAHGGVALGEVISRRKVAAELGMSFLPVSEAFLRLELEGLLESRPRAGTRVRIPSKQDVCDHYIVREGLETQAAKLVAMVATTEERAELSALAVQVDEMGGDPAVDRSAYHLIHDSLHRKIVEYARCRALYEALDRSRVLSSLWFCAGAKTGYRPQRHQRLIEQLTAGTAEQAMEAMREHVVTGRESILAILEPFFDLRESQGHRYPRAPKTKVA